MTSDKKWSYKVQDKLRIKPQLLKHTSLLYSTSFTDVIEFRLWAVIGNEFPRYNAPITTFDFYKRKREIFQKLFFKPVNRQKYSKNFIAVDIYSC